MTADVAISHSRPREGAASAGATAKDFLGVGGADARRTSCLGAAVHLLPGIGPYRVFRLLRRGRIMTQHTDTLPTDTRTPVTKPVPQNAMATEPATIVGTITAAATAIIALLVAFGLDLSDEQQQAILGVVAVAAPVIAAVVIRGKVYAPKTAQEVVNDAAE